MRKINQAGLRLVKDCEGMSLKAYRCPAGVLTIGYGHTGPDVYAGQEITVSEADTLLATDMEKFEQAIEELVAVPLTDNQFSALVSFVFNIGIGKLNSPGGFQNSTLLKFLNEGDFTNAAEQFLRWNKAGGKVLPGLVTRRTKERELFKRDD